MDWILFPQSLNAKVLICNVTAFVDTVVVVVVVVRSLSHVQIFADGALSVKWGRKGEALIQWEWCPSKKARPELLFSLCRSKKVTIYKPRRNASPETKPEGTDLLEFSLQICGRHFPAEITYTVKFCHGSNIPSEQVSTGFTTKRQIVSVLCLYTVKAVMDNMQVNNIAVFQ